MVKINMDMPASCWDCRLSTGENYCAFLIEDTYRFSHKRHPDCPLVEVVQCRDCKHYLPSESKKWDYCTCNEWFDGDGGYQWISPEGYCSYGKRREE